jgi:hypothetical protein
VIARQDIPYSVDEFPDAIQKIFGLEARFLEIFFMKNFHCKAKVTRKRLPMDATCQNGTFQKRQFEYMRFTRQNFETPKIISGNEGFYK